MKIYNRFFTTKAAKTGFVFFLILFLFPVSVFALDVRVGPPIRPGAGGLLHFTDDMDLTVDSLDTSINTFVLGATDPAHVITIDPGKYVTLRVTDAIPPSLYSVWGLYATAGGEITLDKVNIVGDFSNGMFADDGSSISVGDGSIIDAQRKTATGTTISMAAFANRQSAIEVGDNATLKANIFDSGQAVVVAHIDSRITIGNNAVIVNEDFSSNYMYDHYAVYAQTGSVIDIGSGASISTQVGMPAATGAQNRNHVVLAYGVNSGVYYNSAVNIGGNSSIFSDNHQTYGLYSFYGNGTTGAKITLGSDSAITMGGANSYGAFATNGGKIELGDRVTVEMTNTGVWSGATTGSYGLYALYENSGIAAGNDLTIATKGSASYGLVAYTPTAPAAGVPEAVITAGDGLKVTTEGHDAHGIYSTANNSLIAVGKNAAVASSGDYAFGVFANNTGKVTMGENASIATTGSEAHGVAAMNGGVIELAGATISADATKNSAAILAGGASAASMGRVAGDGVFNITGAVLSDDYGVVDLKLRAGSTFTGISDVGATSSTLDLSLTGAHWNVAGNSTVTNLGIDGGSTIDFRMSPNIGNRLTIGNLSATSNGALFIFKADPTTLASDKVIINDADASASSHKIAVSDASSGAVIGDEKMDLIYANGANAANNLTFNLTDQSGVNIPAVDLGGFQYELQNSRAATDNTTWFLRGTGRASQGGSAAIQSFAAAYLLSWAETQTLIQRLGDLRQTPKLAGLWVKTYGGAYEGRGGHFLEGFEMNYWGVQLGADRKLDIFDPSTGDFYGGIMGSYSRGDIEFPTGKGDVDAKTIGVYGTFVSPKGFYADLALKHMWVTNKFDVLTLQGDRVTGKSVNTSGFGASAEVGKRVYFSSNNEGFHVEPQLQVSWQRQAGGHFTASNSLKVNVNPFDSLLGRAGALVGYEVKKGNIPFNVYTKLSVVREFDGKISADLNGSRIKDHFTDTWVTYGAGATMRVLKDHNLYLDFERSNGGKFNAPWAVKAGYRILF